MPSLEETSAEDVAAADALDDNPMFADSWTPERLQQLVEFSEARYLDYGEVLIRAGDRDRTVYIVQEGALEAVVTTASGVRRHPIGPGAVLGELAFFDGSPRSADVVAVRHSLVQSFTEDAVERLSISHPDLGHAFLLDLGRLLAHRLRRAESS